MKKLVSSRLTGFYKFVFPVLWFGFAGWLLAPGLSEGTSKGRFFAVCTLLVLIPATLYILWLSRVIRRVEVQDESIVVSDYVRCERIPLSRLVRVVQRRWPNSHPVMLVLATPCLGRSSIHFVPSFSATAEAERKRKFWQRLRWHAHPIVDELNQLIMETGEQSPAPHSSPEAGSESGEA